MQQRTYSYREPKHPLVNNTDRPLAEVPPSFPQPDPLYKKGVPPRRLTKAERARRKRRRMLVRCTLVGVCALALLAGLVFLIVTAVRGAATALATGASASSVVEYAAVRYDVSGYVFDASDRRLVLVNNNLPYAGDAPETAVADEATGISLETEAAQQYCAMQAAAAADGVALVLSSGARTETAQQALYADCVQRYLKTGATEEEAAAAADAIAGAPGCSEHLTGYAADIVAADAQKLDAAFAQTQSYRWLCRYAAEYGFILRYPEDRQAATGRTAEPWHWRYVGTENAKAIVESGLSLEEFLAVNLLS